MKYILDGNGEPLACEDILDWGMWFETACRRVAVSNIGDYLVSTVFLGIDHNHFKGPPILWETMVFKGKHGLYFDRCAGTREQAEAMHDKMCLRVMKDAQRNHNAASRLVHGV